jgi:hypothetical protein
LGGLVEMENLKRIHEKELEALKDQQAAEMQALLDKQAEATAEEPTEIVPDPVYLKCTHCGALIIEEQWVINEEMKRGPVGMPICPICDRFNIEERADGTEILVSNRIRLELPFTKEQVDALDKVKKEMKVLKKQEEKLMPSVKPFLVENGISQFEYQGHKMYMAYQNRGTMNEEMLLGIIDDKIESLKIKINECVNITDEVVLMAELEELESAIAIERKTAPDQVKSLLANGKITLEEIAPCMVPNIVPVFYLNSKPKKEKDTTANGFGGMF